MTVGKGYMETYGKLLCDGCGKHYFVYLGDMMDQTVGDVEVAICPYCNGRQLLPGVEVFDFDRARTSVGIKELICGKS